MLPRLKRSSFEEREDAGKEEEEQEELSETDSEDDDEGVIEQAANEQRKKKIIIRVVYGKGSTAQSTSSSSSTFLCCQADECGVDLQTAKKYHQRHKVCERHSKAAVVLVSGIRQRFCQQCSKFHEISEFDDTKRSCRDRLAGHNERRRKTHATLTQSEQ
ncbi:hypothetical protein L6164_020241 [Bauhinia variegata]|uniref:Uncharacterized protein n=1 Tax=Bauhinia variegata TaxID=167791 RepID=A0ACB9MUR9_BAUVA|nr:hypothetical protein L6164_020241 [Bauhinia variegata]